MRVWRAYLQAMTASYRFPPFARMQPSLGVPPLSTLYGLLSAAVGRLVHPSETVIGYVAPFKGRGQDLERIHAIGEGATYEGTDVIRRDFVVEPELWLYLDNLSLVEALRTPRYPLLVGRTTDLAELVRIDPVDLKPVSEAEFRFTILPFPWEGVASPILALPIAFDEVIPRRPLAVRPFHILESKPQRVRYDERHGQIYQDAEFGWGVYLHRWELVNSNAAASKI